jgi:hypothetical protein
MGLSSIINRCGRFLTAITFLGIFSTFLTARPAEATLGPAIPYTLQVRGQFQSGLIQELGRAVGTVQFDDGNSYYHLSFVLCRQSSYASPLLMVSVTGTGSGGSQIFSGITTLRPDICGGHGQAYVFDGGFAYNGIIRSLTFTLEGVFMNGSNAERPRRTVTIDNPYN